MIVHTILYVADQEKSKIFYEFVLGKIPSLNVPGMTEFELSDTHILGLMPEQNIKKILGSRLPDPSTGSGMPRVELYFRADNAEEMYLRSIGTGAKELSPFQKRDWGDNVAYVLDFDGHVIAFAKE